VKTAVVHDWLTGMRGGEKVLLHVLELFPDAHLYTIFWNRGSVHPDIERREIHTSFLDRFPSKTRHYRYYLPLYPAAVEAFDMSAYDLVISISHCVARGIVKPPGGIHISYVLTPMRYAWVLGDEYFGTGRLGWPARVLLSPVLKTLRKWDEKATGRVDHHIADSMHVQRRIARFYGRDSRVIYPPVEVENFIVSDRVEDYYLYLGSFAPYKKADLAVRACMESGRKLLVVGSGQDEKRLKKLAAGSPHVKFLGWLDDNSLSEYLRRAKALLFPGEEDFGIVPVEALACGRPVVAYARGGALETLTTAEEKELLIDGSSGNPLFDRPVRVGGGVLFPERDVSAIINALDMADGQKWEPRSLRAMAQRFRPEIFRQLFREEVERVMKNRGAADA